MKKTEFRARNFFWAGVPEPDTDDLDVGKAADLEFVTGLFFRHMKVENSKYKVEDTTRIYGGKDSSGQQGKPRLLRVRFDVPESVGHVARAAPNIRNSEDPVVNQIRVFRDRSRN
ncbi:hypothetical protein Pcinc_004416 [Petrolisthes cinctipes]|uniref:Uncharacterized protein n=1 Tax=Petrolisthes cinctipes TaxID=88211 RepID=A0AAE1GH47_PETCI|nr:hypothetical protein Pcinc_004416 [Petrolisthes cinctipes]